MHLVVCVGVFAALLAADLGCDDLARVLSIRPRIATDLLFATHAIQRVL